MSVYPNSAPTMREPSNMMITHHIASPMDCGRGPSRPMRRSKGDIGGSSLGPSTSSLKSFATDRQTASALLSICFFFTMGF